MNKLKSSLEASKDEILKTLPKELHGAFEEEVKKAADPAPVTAEEELEAIKACASEHPHVDESLISGIEKNPTAHRAEAPPSAEDQAKAVKEALAKVGELVAPPESD